MKTTLDTLRLRLTEHVVGADEAAFFLLTALLAGGHVLIQGAPGIGKTSLGQTLARLIDGKFRRVQFTPDLLPSDLLGHSIFNQATGEFEFVEGPVFSNLVLADEINRTSPRIQSALLECMNESQVSIDGVTRQLETPFLVIATQNNRYAAGTFPLPEPQLDRFLLSVEMQLPDPENQAAILRLHAGGENGSRIEPLATVATVKEWQETVLKLPVADSICRYVVDLCEAARNHPALGDGVSARGSIALMRAAQAAAVLEGHEAVYPDDVKRVAIPVLAHRLSPAGDEYGSELPRRGRVVTVIREILDTVPVP
ncbi:MAG: MoxR family ATPase [Verrucomicrobiae bacterium]|nr:MoxR family ATPase [Verrucomicrobiae bacterium]